MRLFEVLLAFLLKCQIKALVRVHMDLVVMSPTEIYYKTILCAFLAPAAREYMMSVGARHIADYAVPHLATILSNSSGGKVSMPSSLASSTTLSMKFAISFES